MDQIGLNELYGGISVEDYLKNLPDTPRKYLFREIPRYLEITKTTATALSEKLKMNRNTIGGLISEKFIESSVNPDTAGHLIQEIAPNGIHRRILEKYYPWLRAKSEELSEAAINIYNVEEHIQDENISRMLDNTTNFSLFSQASIGHGLRLSEVNEQWGASGINKIEHMKDSGYIIESEDGKDDRLFKAKNSFFRTLSIKSLTKRLGNCLELLNMFSSPKESLTAGLWSGEFDEKSTLEIKEAFWDYQSKIREIRNRKQNGTLRKMFVCAFSGEFYAKRKK